MNSTRLGFIIQIKYGLPYCVTCPSMSTDPGSLNPGTRRSRVPGRGIPGSVRILGQVTQFWQNILNLYYSTGSWKLFSYPLLAFCVRGRQCEYQLKVETCDHELCTQPITTTTTNTSAFNNTSRHKGDKYWIQQVLVGLSSSFPINYTCYHYTAVW